MPKIWHFIKCKDAVSVWADDISRTVRKYYLPSELQSHNPPSQAIIGFHQSIWPRPFVSEFSYGRLIYSYRYIKSNQFYTCSTGGVKTCWTSLDISWKTYVIYCKKNIQISNLKYFIYWITSTSNSSKLMKKNLKSKIKHSS